MASSPPFQVEDQTDEDFFDKLVNDDEDFKVISSPGTNLADDNDSDEVKAFANLSIGKVGTGSEDSGHECGTETEGEAIDEDAKASLVDNHMKDSVDAHIKESSSLVSSNSFAFDSVIESNNGAIGTEVASNSFDSDSVLESNNGVIGTEVASNSFGFDSVFESNNDTIGTEVESNSFGFDSVIESNNDPIRTEVASDSTGSKNSGSASSGVKEVQWSAFHTASVQNGSNGFGSHSDFFNEFGDGAVESLGDNLNSESNGVSGSEENRSAYLENAHNHDQYREGHVYGAMEQSTDGQDLNNSQYWENLYPGWKYDYNTGQWYQVDGYDMTANVQESSDSNSATDWAVSNEKSEVSYLQQKAQSVVGSVAESGTTESVTNLNQVSQGNNGYPSHMVFDPQYPGWYYDMIAQEWRSLDTYISSAQSTAYSQDQLNLNGVASFGTSHEKDQNGYGQVDNYGSEGFSSQGQSYNWTGSFCNSNQQGLNMWQPDSNGQGVASSELSGNQQLENHHGPNSAVNNHVSQQKSYDYGGTVPFYEKARQGRNEISAFSGSHGFVPGGNLNQQFIQPRIEHNEYMDASNDLYGNQNSASYSQQPFQSGHQFSYAPTAGRSSAGRPPHALVTFGFGGKLIVMRDNISPGNSSYGSQDPVGGSISILNLTEVVNESAAASSNGAGLCDYFRTLCRQPFPGPLTGGNVGVKELNKWIDESIAHCESPDMDYRKGEVLRLLLSLLKIACQHYGKLRSPFGTDTALKESDVPESAVARLFASAKRNGAQFNDYGALTHCLQNLPSEGQMRATAAEVQTLLVSGRKKEALHCAQEGQLWGPALVLAAQLGDQFYVDTVKQMALRQLVTGSPLRTLCLLIAGQPADVFSTGITPDSGIYSAVNTSQQPVQLGANGMLDDWEENLAVITANRTKDDELVLIHLGDCLWKERSGIIAAHICYLVAEANFEPYSDSARFCLLGADHWKFPRTYTSPEAIQMTEIYEYSKLLGNSQFILLPFQPYKIIYAHMLAEVGRLSDSLKYCQAVSKSLKTGRAPEVETWRQFVSSLEDRIRTHQQGGFSTNLAPSKLVGKLLNLFDSTAHRVVGGLPPPAPSTSVGSGQGNVHYHQSMGPRVSSSQSTMAMSSLMPSASVEPINEWTADGNRRTMHNRSASEPDFGRTSRQDQVDSSKEASSANRHGKASVSGATSRFGRFSLGSQIFQKTVGLVLKPRQDKQAKLGEQNKFYYDEKLKRWVEEGADPPAEEAALPPPPTIGTFSNGTSDYNLKSALKSDGSLSNGSPEYKSPTSLGHSSGIPPIPPTSNQFSARGRMGVRSRYVDTFNQGGGTPTNLFQSPSAPSIKSTNANPKFFVPTPVSSVEHPVDYTVDSLQQSAAINENPSNPTMNDSFHSPLPPSSMAMQRFASMKNISSNGTTSDVNGNRSFTSHSRRTASWSGSIDDSSFSPPNGVEIKPLGEVLGMPPSSFMPTGPTLAHSSMNGGSYGDDLHEVEL